MPLVKSFMCSQCSRTFATEGRIRRHARQTDTCSEARVLTAAVEVTFPTSLYVDEQRSEAATEVRERRKPGPKPLDMTAVMRGQIPFAEEGEREDYAIEHQTLDTVLGSAGGIPLPMFFAKMFSNLWGKLSPDGFKSVVVHGSKVYLAPDEEGAIESRALTHKFARSVACMVLDVSIRICEDQEDRVPGARTMLDQLTRTFGDGEVGLRDALERNDDYTAAIAKLPNLRQISDDIATAVKNAMCATST